MNRYKGNKKCDRCPPSWTDAVRENTPQCSECGKRCCNGCKFASPVKRVHVISDNVNKPSLGRYREPELYLDPKKFCYPCDGNSKYGGRMPPFDIGCNPQTGFAFGNGIATTREPNDCYYAYTNGKLGSNFYSGWPAYFKAY
jgi:hypothetical protein